MGSKDERLVNLHVHSVFSTLDGRGLIEDYIKLAQADGQSAFALTDHGVLGGIVEAYTACKKASLKFIPGVEAYLDEGELRGTKFPGHLTVLATNESGYRSLIAANNLAHRQFYYRPRITLQQLIDNDFCRDWIILSGCQSSVLHRYPLTEEIEVIKLLQQKCAGFFLEFMWHYSEKPDFNQSQNEYLERVASLHKATDAPMVITNDCHYAYKFQEEIHSQLLGLAKTEEAKEGIEFDGEGFYFKSVRDLEGIAKQLGVGDAVDNANRIAAMCDVHIPEADHTNWYVPDITGGKPEETLKRLCREALGCPDCNQHETGYCPADPEYIERYEYEFSVLKTSPAILNSYLVTYDLVSWCNTQDIPVAARGSMGGSLISWLLGITKEDPIKWNLSFSRAVNPARPTIPDFDLDVSSIRRGEILDYLKQRYDNNIPIAAYTHYGPKGALRKVLRIEGLHAPPQINELCKPLPDDWSDGDFEYSPGHKHYIGNKPWTEYVPENYRDYMAIYKGLYSSVSVHPSGILVSGKERPLENEIPIQWVASSGTATSAYDMYTLKKLGLFKLDVLGLRTLDQLAYMERVSGDKPPNDDYDEREVLDAFGSDCLASIFQMDGWACREVIRSIRGIRTFEDLIAANTLARPGCAQFAPYYRSGYESLMRKYPDVQGVLSPTNGLILYQEQVMEIARLLADFDDAEQDDIKEAIKYFRHEVWQETIEPLFKQRCEAKGIESTEILGAIANMASYTYNRAHSMTYAAIAYKMMFYKVKFPAIFYAAVYDAADDKQRLVLESQFFKVKWHPADINISEHATIVKDGEIFLGLNAIKGVGPQASVAILVGRPYSSLEDLENRVERRKCNKAVIAKLKEAFALESLGIQGTLSSFQETYGFNKRMLDSELSEELSQWKGIGKIAGFVTKIRSFNIKKPGPNQGKEMAFLSIINYQGERRCILFPQVWSRAKGKIYDGYPIRLEGEDQIDGTFIVNTGYAI